MLNQKTYQKAKSLRDKKYTFAEISFILGISDKTARRYLSQNEFTSNNLKKYESSKFQQSKPAKATKLSPFKNEIKRLINNNPDISARKIFRLLRENGYNGGLSQLIILVRQIRAESSLNHVHFTICGK